MFVTGLEYDNGRVGYFLADENFENWVPINSFEEYLKYNPDFQVDIPNTQDNFKEFLDYPKDKKENACRRAAFEATFIFLSNGNVNEYFDKIDKFLSYFESANDELGHEIALSIITHVLHRNLFQFKAAIERSGIPQENWPIQTFEQRYEHLHECYNSRYPYPY